MMNSRFNMSNMLTILPGFTMRATVRSLVLLLLAASGTGAFAALPWEEKKLNEEGIELFRKGKFKEAEERFTKAAESDKNNPAYRYNVGVAKYRNGKTDEAKSEFNSVFSENNAFMNAAAEYNTGIIEHKAAQEQLEKMKAPMDVQGQPVDPKEFVSTAKTHLTKALENYKQALLKAPDDRDMKKNYEIAKKQLEELNRQQPPEEEQESSQSDKQDEQQQNQQSDDQQQQDQKSQDNKDQQDQNQNPQQSDEQDKQEQEQSDKEQQDGQQKEDEQNKPGEEKNEQEKAEDGKPKPTPTPTPSPEKEPQEGKDPKENEGKAGGDPEQSDQVPIGEMSPEDVERLLNALPSDDQQALQRLLNNQQPIRQPEMENDW